MAYSIQTAVSDGTLAVLDLSIRYMDKSHIQVYVDDVLADGTAYSYVWLTDTRIQIVPTVASGSTLRILRKTLTDEMWHEFKQGARFSTTSMDENFEQLLFLAQEYSEGTYVSDFYTDIDMHLKRIVNIADPVSDGDAVNLKTLKDFLPYEEAAAGLATRVTAEEQHTAALAGSYGSGLVGAATYAQLRAYTGNATRMQIGGRTNYFDGCGGVAVRTGSKPDNDGTVWVDALGRSWERQFEGPVSVAWFGAHGAVDDTGAVQKAITAVAAAGGGSVLFPPKHYTLLGKVLVASNISIDLGGSVITGSMASPMFESGYLTGGGIVTNVGTPNESNILTNCSIRNGTIKSSLLAINVFNFTSNCEVSDIVFNDCRQNFQATRSFYSRWRNLLSRPTVANTYANVPSFVLYDNNNAMLLDGVYITGRDYAGLIHGASFQLNINNCGAEGGRVGFVFENETFALSVTNCYFETMSGACLDFTYAAQNTGTNIDCNWFHNVATAITGQLLIGGSIGPSNVYSGTTNKVIISDDNYSSIEVNAPSNDGASNAPPGISSGFTLGKKVQVVGFGSIYNSVSGAPQIATASAPKLIPFNLYGDAGAVTANQIPYCTHASSGGANFNIQVTTGITYQEKTTFLAFRFTVSDNVGTYDVYGMVFGGIVKQFDTSGKTVTISANGGGNIVLSIGVMNHPSSAYSITGMVRHV